MKLYASLVAFLFAILSAVSVVAPVYAQEGSGIKIVPAQVNELADPGETLEIEFVVNNLSDEEKEYYLYKRNIKGVEAGGVPIFSEDAAEPTGYEMSEWILFENETVTVPARGEQVIPVSIVVPENASPGSHFGGIFVSVEPPKLRETGAGVGYEVASILSIRIAGDVVDSASIRSFSTDKLFYTTKDVNFHVKLENKGNILIQPRGPLTITSMFGGEPAKMTINDSLAGVFPHTVRDFNFTWEEEGLGFGRYTADLALVYSGATGNRTIDAALVFWVFPTKVIVPVLGVLIFLILGGYLFTRFYINKAVARAQGGRRMVARQYRHRVGVSRFAFVFTTLMAMLVIFLILMLIFFA